MDFERDRKRQIVWQWRSGVRFNEIVDYFGMDEKSVALIIMAAQNPIGPIHRFGKTMAEVMKEERRARKIRIGRIDLTQSQIRDRLSGEITTQAIRRHLEDSLSPSDLPVGQTRRAG